MYESILTSTSQLFLVGLTFGHWPTDNSWLSFFYCCSREKERGSGLLASSRKKEKEMTLETYFPSTALDTGCGQPID